MAQTGRGRGRHTFFPVAEKNFIVTRAGRLTAGDWALDHPFNQKACKKTSINPPKPFVFPVATTLYSFYFEFYYKLNLCTLCSCPICLFF